MCIRDSEWYLQLFYFAVPVLGLGILAAGLADFCLLYTSRCV